MSLKIGIVLAVLAAILPTANAIIVNVEVGDRPYYIHGPGYYVGRGLLGLGSGTLGLAAPSQSLDPRPLRTALSRRTL
jgi:hypothetical protein